MPRVQHQLVEVAGQAGLVGLEGLLGPVLASVVDGDAH